MDDNKPTTGKERLPKGIETPRKKGPLSGIMEYMEASEQIETDKYAEAAEKIRNLKGNVERTHQLDEISALNTALVSVMAKLEKKGVKIDKLRRNPSLLQEYAATKGIMGDLNLAERAALEELPRLFTESGDTGNYLREAWVDIVDQGETAGRGWTGKVRRFVKKHPVGTVALLVAGAAGLYLTYSAIKALWSKKGEKEATEGEKKKGSWFKTKVLIPIGIMIAGAIIGKKALKRLMGGLDLEGLEDLLKKGEAIPEDMRKMIEEQAKKIEKLEAAAQKAKAAKDKAVGAVAGVAGTAKEKAKKAAETVKEEIEDEQTQRIAAEKLFVNIFFYHKEFKDIKSDLEWAIVNMYPKNLSELKEIYSKYKDKKEIPLNALGIKQKKISKKHLFLLVKNILDVQGRLKVDDSESVESLFTKMIKDPVFRMNEAIHTEMLDKLKDGDIEDAIAAIHLSDVKNLMVDKRDSFLDKIDTNLNLTEGLDDEQKRAFRKLQILLFASGKRMNGDAKSAISDILGRKSIDHADNLVIEKAEQFFDNIKNKTEDLLPHLKKRFQIEELEGIRYKNHLADGLIMDNLQFSDALQLVVISEGINWSSNDKNTVHWMKDLVLLSTIIRALPTNYKTEYLTILSKAIVKSETIDINIPGIESLLPYLNKLKEFIVNKGVEEGHGILQAAAYLRDSKPSESEQFAQLVKESPFMSFGDEALGGTIEMGTDSLAAMVSILGITPEELGGTETAEELLHLISHKVTLREDGSSIMYDLNNPVGVVVNIGWKYFVLKPKGIILETLKSVSDGDFGGAAKVWAVGSAPFVAIGAGKGLLSRSVYTITRWGRVKAMLKGAGKGLMYPIYAPYLVAKTGVKATKGLATVAIAGKEYVRRPFMYGGEVVRWVGDKIRLKKVWYPGQNIHTMMNNGDLFSRYLKDAPRAGLSIKEKWELFKTDKLSILKRLGGNFNEEMALKYAGRFAKKYNDFFLFGKEGGRLLADEISSQSISTVQDAYNRMDNFMRAYGAGEYDDIFKKIGELVKKGDKGGTLVSDIEKLLKSQIGVGILTDNEAGALAKQFKTTEDLNRFLTRMGDGKKYMEARRTGLLSRLFKPTSLDEALKTAGNDLAKAQQKVAEATAKLEKARKSGRGIKSAEKALQKAKEAESKIAGKVKDYELAKSKAAIEVSDSLDDVGNLLKSAGSDLKGIGKRVADAAAKLEKAKKTGKGIDQAQEAFNKARKAEIDLRKSISQLKKVQRIENEIDKARKAGSKTKTLNKLLKQLAGARQSAATSLDAAQESAKVINHVGKLAKFGRFMGRAVPLAFAAISVYEAGTSFHEALTTDVEGRAGIAAGKAALWTANAAADIVAVAIGAGAQGAAGVAGRVWIPLIPVTYAGTEIFDTLYEGTLTEAEWAQKYSYDELVHQWFTTCNSVSLGDAWVTGFASFASLDHGKEVDKSMAEKLQTAHKIFKFMVTAEKNPEVMNILGSSESAKIKTKKIESEIGKTYTKYHEYYFRHNSIERIQNYGSAQEYVAEANLFDEIMQTRKTLKERGVAALMMGHENLLDERYDIEGTVDNPQAKKMFLPTALIENYKKSMVDGMKEKMLPEAFANMESMETPYLLRLAVQIYSALGDTSQFDEESELAQNFAESLLAIKNYLTYKRGVNFNTAIRKYDFSKPKMGIKELVKHLEDFSVADSPSYKNFEKNNFDQSPGVHAVYRLAQYFGYAGEAKEKDLKEYLNSDSASYHGVYWDGSEWTVRERGYELDDEVGPNLDRATVSEMVSLLRENPDNILEHRHDTIFADSYDYTSQITRMADILENGYEEGVKKYESHTLERPVMVT